MVYKEDICTWFGGVRSSERVALMCSLLQKCNPLELRFLGSCIEDLARKNFTSLRDHELRANDRAELCKVEDDLLNKEIRSALVVYFSLLYSNNYVCSNVMFDILNRAQEELCSRFLPSQNQNDHLEVDILEDVILLFTLASHHPAFTFGQREHLYQLLQTIEKLLCDRLKKNSEGACDGHAADPSLSSSMYSSVYPPNTYLQCNPSPVSEPKPVHVENLELKRSHWKALTKCHEFHLLVTWSNGQRTEVSKSYQDIHAFHAVLLKLFPKDAGAHKQERLIPFLGQDRGPRRKEDKDMAELMHKYFRQLLLVPEYILQCEHLTKFFAVAQDKSHSLASPISIKTGDEDLYGSVPTSKIQDMCISHAMDSSSILSEGVNLKLPIHETTMHSITTPVHQSSPLPSPLTSPHMSPSPSLTGSNSSRAASPTTMPNQPLTIGHWLKSIRLHKYSETLSKLTWEQLFSITESELEIKGMTDGARRKFFKEINNVKLGYTPANGVAMPMPMSPSSTCMEWHSPPHSSCLTSPQLQSMPVQPIFPGCTNIASSIDGSTCSEFSPPTSPITHHTICLPEHMCEATNTDTESVGHESTNMLGISPEQLLLSPLIGEADGMCTFLPIGTEPNGKPPEEGVPLMQQMPPPHHVPFGSPIIANPMAHMVMQPVHPPTMDPQMSFVPRTPTGQPVRSPRPQPPIKHMSPGPVVPLTHHHAPGIVPILANNIHMNGLVEGNKVNGNGITIHQDAALGSSATMSTASVTSIISTPDLPNGIKNPNLVPYHHTVMPVSHSPITIPPPPLLPQPVGPAGCQKAPLLTRPCSSSPSPITCSIAFSTDMKVQSGVPYPPPPLNMNTVRLPLTSVGDPANVSYSIFPNGNVSSSASVTYSAPHFHAQVPLAGSVSVAYAPPSASPVGHTPSPVAPGTPTPVATPTTVPTPVPPTNGVAPGSGCGVCSCCGGSGVGGQTPTLVNNYNIQGSCVWPHTPTYPHASYVPNMSFMTSNGLITPGISSLPFTPQHTHPPPPAPPAPPHQGMHHHPFNLPNGFTPDLLYNHTNFSLVNMPNQRPHPLASFHTNHMMNFAPPPGPYPFSIHKGKGGLPMCFNCGVTGHRATECEKNVPEGISRGAQFHLNMEPKMQCD